MGFSMKLRTGLVAATTAAAVLTSGAVAADAKPVAKDPNGNETSLLEELKNSSAEDLSPQEIKDWIAAITAVIALMLQIFTPLRKLMR